MRTLRAGPAAFATASLLSSVVAAQPSPTINGQRTDDVIQLSEFSVTSASDRGYVASETITGSRMATKIIDLPYAISVVTSEFMQDFDVFDFSSAVNGLAAGVTGASDEGSVTIRGTSTNN